MNWRRGKKRLQEMAIRKPLDMKSGAIFKTSSYGDIEVIEYFNALNVLIAFKDTGTVVKAASGNIRMGSVKDPCKPNVFGVGFYGIGEFKAKVNGKNTPAYDRWHDMIRRCYSEAYQNRFPTYKECSVDDNWHNFQNFAKWFYDNYPNDGKEYDLDKDIIKDGNKVYSSDFCKFVTKQENYEKAHARFYYFKKDGEPLRIFNLRDFCNGNEKLRKKLVALNSGRVRPFDGWDASSEIEWEAAENGKL